MNELPPKEMSKSAMQLLPEHVGEYAETFIRLAGLKASKKAANITYLTLSVVVLTVSVMVGLLFLGLGMAAWIGESLQSAKWGYYIVSGFWFMCTMLFFLVRKKLILPFMRTYIIRKIYE